MAGAAVKSVVTIDGAFLEGGGQILRNAASLSCLLKQPVCVNKIRAGRSNPGLRPQHLTGLQLIAEICQGKLDGGRVKSTEITLYPGDVKGGNFTGDTKTAGSICLLLQAALPCLLYSNTPSCLTLRGGTNADMAPPLDYFQMVFGPMTSKFGVKFTYDIKRRGFFPKGGGEVKVDIAAIKSLNNIQLTDRGDIKLVKIFSFVAGALPVKVARIMADHCEGVIKKYNSSLEVKQDIVQVAEREAVGSGCGIMAVAETTTGCLLAGNALGKKGVPAETVGDNAGNSLVDNLKHGGCVDEYLQDQLIVLMALAKGKSEVLCGPVSLHTQTAIHIAETLTTAKFNIKKQNDTSSIIECEGIGLENQSLFK